MRAELLEELFPIETCSRRLKETLLRKFNGRCPTILEVSETPAAHWNEVPGMGSASLRELRRVVQDMPKKIRTRSLVGLTTNELFTRHTMLRDELRSLHNELRRVRQELKAIEIELKVRGGPTRKNMPVHGGAVRGRGGALHRPKVMGHLRTRN